MKTLRELPPTPDPVINLDGSLQDRIKDSAQKLRGTFVEQYLSCLSFTSKLARRLVNAPIEMVLPVIGPPTARVRAKICNINVILRRRY